MVDRTLRPVAPLTSADPAEHRRQIAVRANAALPKDGTEGMTKPLLLKSLTVSELTGEYAASLWTGGLIYVSDESGGAVPAFSDGTDWRRVTDRAIVS